MQLTLDFLRSRPKTFTGLVILLLAVHFGKWQYLNR